MKIDLLLKIQKILGLLFSMLTEIENAKSEDELSCYEKLGYALSSLMIYFTNQERLFSECVINYNIY